jgi:hypothetical protein
VPETTQLVSANSSASLYETDFHAWTQEQAELLRQGQLSYLDREHLAEEIESLGQQQRQELENRFGVLLGHLLKWQFQPSQQSKSWIATIREQRRKIQRLIQQNPSLKPYLPEAIAEGYESGLALVIRETPLDYKDLPNTCPYTAEQTLDNNFLPGPEG